MVLPFVNPNIIYTEHMFNKIKLYYKCLLALPYCYRQSLKNSPSCGFIVRICESKAKWLPGWSGRGRQGPQAPNTSFTGKVNRESCSTYICTNAKGFKEKGSGVEGPPTNHKACFSERGNYCIRAYSDFKSDATPFPNLQKWHFLGYKNPFMSHGDKIIYIKYVACPTSIFMVIKLICQQ